MSTLNFDANSVDPSVGFDPIPAGKYLAVIVDSETKPTKAGTGEYLQLEFEVIEGDYKGRKLWARLNIKNPNADAVRMAQADLSAICRAVNVMTPHDSVELHNLPLTVTVRCRKNQDDEIVNEIKSFGPREANTNGSHVRRMNCTPIASLARAREYDAHKRAGKPRHRLKRCGASHWEGRCHCAVVCVGEPSMGVGKRAELGYENIAFRAGLAYVDILHNHKIYEMICREFQEAPLHIVVLLQNDGSIRHF